MSATLEPFSTAALQQVIEKLARPELIPE